MHSRVRAVVYGVGAMGTIVTRLLLEKGVDIVGALARSDEKVGRDLGEVAGLGRTLNVTVERDARRVLGERQPDIALIAVSSYMDDMAEHLRICAEAGVNAVTIAEEALYPWGTSPMATAELDALAKRHGVTLTGSGHQDAYWVNLVSNVMGTAHRIDAVRGRASWNVDDYGPEVARDQQVGRTVDEFEAWLAHEDLPPSFGRNVLDALAADAGLTVIETLRTTRPEVTSDELPCRSLETVVAPGRVCGFTDVDTLRTLEGPVLTFEMTGRVYREGEADGNDWEIEGEPRLVLANPAVPTQITTCTQMVNRVPDVINAPPGFVTVDRLPKLRYRPFPLGVYVNGSRAEE